MNIKNRAELSQRLEKIEQVILRIAFTASFVVMTAELILHLAR